MTSSKQANTLAWLHICSEPSLAFATGPTSTHQRVTWIIKEVNRIPTHCGVAYVSVCLLARGHVIRVWQADTLICHTTMRRNAINLLYIPGHVTL